MERIHGIVRIANGAGTGFAKSHHALGTAAYVQVLLARQQARQAQLGLIAAQAQRLADSAALYQASAPEADQNFTSARSHSVRPGSLMRTPPG